MYLLNRVCSPTYIVYFPGRLPALPACLPAWILDTCLPVVEKKQERLKTAASDDDYKKK